MDKDKLGKELPDAATAFVIVKEQGQADKLLLFYEYRYPTGSYMLGLPAGLIDPADLKKENPILDAMKREIKEETGLTVKDTDQWRSSRTWSLPRPASAMRATPWSRPWSMWTICLSSTTTGLKAPSFLATSSWLIKLRLKGS